jgi:hypothetical protein
MYVASVTAVALALGVHVIQHGRSTQHVTNDNMHS